MKKIGFPRKAPPNQTNPTRPNSTARATPAETCASLGGSVQGRAATEPTDRDRKQSSRRDSQIPQRRRF